LKSASQAKQISGASRVLTTGRVKKKKNDKEGQEKLCPWKRAHTRTCLRKRVVTISRLRKKNLGKGNREWLRINPIRGAGGNKNDIKVAIETDPGGGEKKKKGFKASLSAIAEKRETVAPRSRGGLQMRKKENARMFLRTKHVRSISGKIPRREGKRGRLKILHSGVRILGPSGRTTTGSLSGEIRPN